jgi:L-ascorbate metabolism protein UlaG (beta-lactamase superfamily)
MRGRALACVLAACLSSCAPVPLPREGAYQGSDADVAVTRIVHGSYVLSVRTTRFVVDPWFYSGTMHRQDEPLGLRPEALPPAAAVILTQEGADHFDEDALVALAKTIPRAVAPAPLAARLLGLGFVDVRGLRPWERTAIESATVTAVPSSGGDAQLGFVVAVGDVRVYLAGDTRAFDGLVDVATAFPDLDVAFLPIGGRRVLGVLRDMDPAQAAAAVAVLQPAVVIPTDYGAQGLFPFVWYTGDPVGRFRTELGARGLGRRLVALEPGESWHRF